jgi:hypothetical protein
MYDCRLGVPLVARKKRVEDEGGHDCGKQDMCHQSG